MAANKSTDWLRVEIGNGMQRLLVLSLPNTPAFDLLEHTAQVWYEALSSMRSDWDEAEDVWRVQIAFLCLCREMDRFPSPKQLIERLPARKEKPSLPKPKVSEEDREYGLKMAAEIMKKLGGKVLWIKRK